MDIPVNAVAITAQITIGQGPESRGYQTTIGVQTHKIAEIIEVSKIAWSRTVEGWVAAELKRMEDKSRVQGAE